MQGNTVSKGLVVLPCKEETEKPFYKNTQQQD